MLKNDLAPFERAIKSKVTSKLTQSQFDALVLFVFNIGITAFSGSSVLKLINDPTTTTSYGSLELAWKAWSKSQGKQMQGLVNRRNSEWDVYSKGLYKAW